MRLSTDALRPWLGGIGAIGLVVTLGLFIIYGGFTLEARIGFAVSVLLLGLAVALGPEDLLRRVRGRNTLRGGKLAAIALIAIAILAVINVLGARHAQRWDLTAAQQFTLSQKTLAILSQLEANVTVSAFYSSDDPRRSAAEDLLKEYHVHANGRLSYEFIDPEMEPTRAIALGVRDFGTLVFQQENRRQSVTGVSEQDFTSALLKLTRPERKKVYFTQGHGERRLDDPGPEGYSQVKLGLERDNYIVETVSLLITGQVPLDAAVLVIAGPSQNFAVEEKEAIKDFLATGGKVALLLDPRTEVDFNDLLSHWNVRIGNDPVFDAASAFLGDSGIPVVQRYQFHPITQNLRSASFFPFVAHLELPEARPEGVSITPLAQSSERSWVETDLQNARFDEGVDLSGPVPLAAVIEADATVRDPARQAALGGQALLRARVMLFGDSDFVSNNFLRIPSGNLDLFLNSINWLAEAEDLISIRPRPQDVRRMFLTGVEMNAILVSTTIFLPLLVLVAGAVVWWTRR